MTGEAISPGGALALASRALARSPCELARWTPPQRAAIADTRRIVLWRDGNRLGKSYWLAYEVAARMQGLHPGQRFAPPLRVLAGGPTIEQLARLQGMIWTLLGGTPEGPGPWLDGRLQWVEGRGITGTKYPHLRLVRGPGAGSIVQFFSYSQGTGRLGGASAHLVVLDEPPPESIWGEVRPRILDVGGSLRVAFTPTPSSPPVDYLRRMVEKDAGRRIGHHNHHLTAANTRTEGAPWGWLTDQEIEDYGGDLLERERRMRIEGWWEPQVEGRILTLFSADWNVRAFDLSEIPRPATLGIGIDHGLQANKQRAVLCAFVGQTSLRPRVWFLDEAIGGGATTTEQDADAILAMLRRHGLGIGDVDIWIGDRSARGGTGRTKSNARLRRALADRVRLPLRRLAKIPTPSKSRTSVWDGARLMNNIFGRRDQEGVPHGLVHPRCVELAKACEVWNGDRRHPAKDILDAARYIVERVCRAELRRSGVLVQTQRSG